MFDDNVSIWPFLQTPQRPPQPDVHTTGSPSQNSTVFGGAFGGGTSPPGTEHGGGNAIAVGAPTPSDAAAIPPAAAKTAKVVFIEGISITPASAQQTAT